MQFTFFITQYLAWHYSGGVKGYLVIWGNLIWFAYNFFSIPVLLRTLFSPFQRLNEEYKKGLDLGAIGSALIVNSVMRFVGAFARGTVIIMGTAFLVIIISAGAALFAAWLLLPLVMLTFLLLGINGLMR